MLNKTFSLNVHSITYLIGVDGGGTHTRLAIADINGIELARVKVGASGLINGIESAWRIILNAIEEAFANLHQAVPDLSTMAIGLGLAGVHNKSWAVEFIEKNPGFAWLKLETDIYTALLGAHQGKPGGIIVLGTGSGGEALFADGSRCEVGGWGFPCGDEASGARLGLSAVNYAQQVLDKRAELSEFSDAVITHCGGNRDALFDWLARANQSAYAQLAPLVVSYADQEKNLMAKEIMKKAAIEIKRMVWALDKSCLLPIALCGSLAKPFEKYLSSELVMRLVPAYADAVSGGLLLIKKALANHE